MAIDARGSARARGTIAPWIAFLAAHAFVVGVASVWQNTPAYDVILGYGPWAHEVLSGSGIRGVTVGWVYPPAALLPIVLVGLLAQLFTAFLGPASYLLSWAMAMTFLNAIAFEILLGRGTSRGRRAAAWFWCAGVALAGPAGLFRLDAVTVPIAVVALLWIVRRPAVASALLALAAWIKVWPAALLLSCLVTVRRRGRIIAGALVATALVLGAALLAVVLAGGDAALPFGFLGAQFGRGLQAESVAATPYVWMAALGGARIGYDLGIQTYQVTGPGSDAVAAVLTPLLIAVIAGLAVWGWLRRGAGMRMLAPLGLAMTTAMIVCNKVGSPQFVVWLLAPAIAWIVWDRRGARTPAILVLLACGLTQLDYPVFFVEVVRAEPLGVLVLTARNLVLIALLLLCVRRAALVPGRTRAVRAASASGRRS